MLDAGHTVFVKLKTPAVGHQIPVLVTLCLAQRIIAQYDVAALDQAYIETLVFIESLAVFSMTTGREHGRIRWLAGGGDIKIGCDVKAGQTLKNHFVHQVTITDKSPNCTRVERRPFCRQITNQLNLPLRWHPVGVQQPARLFQHRVEDCPRRLGRQVAMCGQMRLHQIVAQVGDQHAERAQYARGRRHQEARDAELARQR